MQRRHWLPIFAAVFLFEPASAQQATLPSGCQYEGPVFDVHPQGLTQVGGEWRAGPWTLPRNSASDVASRVRIQLIIRETPSAQPPSWTVDIVSDYDVENSAGTEYLVDAFRVAVGGWFGESVQMLDFSEQCRTLGHSLYPGTRWVQSLRIPRGPDASTPRGLQFSVWGHN